MYRLPQRLVGCKLAGINQGATCCRVWRAKQIVRWRPTGPTIDLDHQITGLGFREHVPRVLRSGSPVCRISIADAPTCETIRLNRYTNDFNAAPLNFTFHLLCCCAPSFVVRRELCAVCKARPQGVVMLHGVPGEADAAGTAHVMSRNEQAGRATSEEQRRLTKAPSAKAYRPSWSSVPRSQSKPGPTSSVGVQS